MVCLSCFIIPICLWIWFQFIMPLIMKIKSILFPGTVVKAEENKDDPKKYECPFDFCKKKTPTESEKETPVAQEDKKDL